MTYCTSDPNFPIGVARRSAIVSRQLTWQPPTLSLKCSQGRVPRRSFAFRATGWNQTLRFVAVLRSRLYCSLSIGSSWKSAKYLTGLRNSRSGLHELSTLRLSRRKRNTDVGIWSKIESTSAHFLTRVTQIPSFELLPKGSY